MALSVYEQKVDSIRKMLKQKIYHHFVFEHIVSPDIDGDRILMLSMAADGTNIPEKYHQHYISSAMLVQIALDTHDKVSGRQQTLTERQLTVLAGDYFSGLYYHLLSEIEDVEFIRTLAHAIKLINEYKISVYQLDMTNVETFMSDFKKIETTVIEEYCRHFQSNCDIQIFIEFLYLKKLMFELDQFNKGCFSILFEGLKKFHLPHKDSTPLLSLSQADQHNLKNICSRYIEQSKAVLLNASGHASTLPPPFKARMTELANSYKDIAT